MLHQIINENRLPCSPAALKNLCSACPLEKSSRLSLTTAGNCSKSVLDLVFSDVWGPSPTLSSSGHKCFVIFVDNY